MRASDRSNRSKKLDVSRSHRAEDMQHEHHDECECASSKASVETFKSAEYRVHGNTADERCQHKRIRNTPIANIVISNDDRQGDEKNHVYNCYGHPFFLTSARVLGVAAQEIVMQL